MDPQRTIPANNRAPHQDLIEAKSALRDNAHAGFKAQAPHLRQILENLPLLPPQAAAPPHMSAKQAVRQRLEELLNDLESKWIAYYPPSSHEGAIALDVSDAPDVLTLTFSMFLWSKTTKVLRLTIARVAQDAFLCWTLDQNALYAPSDDDTPGKPGPAVRDRTTSHRQAPDFLGRTLAWLQRRGWATSAIVMLVYILVFGIIGALVGGMLGAAWGWVAWGDADAVLTMGGAWALTLGALGATAGLIFGLLETRRQDRTR